VARESTKGGRTQAGEGGPGVPPPHLARSESAFRHGDAESGGRLGIALARCTSGFRLANSRTGPICRGPHGSHWDSRCPLVRPDGVGGVSKRPRTQPPPPTIVAPRRGAPRSRCVRSAGGRGAWLGAPEGEPKRGIGVRAMELRGGRCFLATAGSGLAKGAGGRRDGEGPWLRQGDQGPATDRRSAA